MDNDIPERVAQFFNSRPYPVRHRGKMWLRSRYPTWYQPQIVLWNLLNEILYWTGFNRGFGQPFKVFHAKVFVQRRRLEICIYNTYWPFGTGCEYLSGPGADRAATGLTFKAGEQRHPGRTLISRKNALN